MRRTPLVACVLLVLVAAAPIATATAGMGAGHAADTMEPATVDAGSAAVQQEDCSFPVTMTDATGTEVTIDQRPERVTTLNPSAAQTMWEIDGREQVVGLTRFASYLEGADERTNVSASGFGVSVEKVVGTEPDLVLVPNASSPEQIEGLRDAGLTVYVLPAATTIDDVSDKTETIGRLTGNCEGAAEATAWMSANVQEAREITGDAERPETIYPLGSGFVAGDATFINDMIETAGGQNLAAEEVAGYQRLSAEVVIELDPEVVVVTPGSASLLSESPYNQTTAGQNGASAQVPTRYMNQPAPRSVVLGVRALVEAFHADADPEWTERSAVSVGTEATQTTVTEAMQTTATEATQTTQSPDETTAGNGPGFGVVPAVIAVVGAALAVLSRRRS